MNYYRKRCGMFTIDEKLEEMQQVLREKKMQPIFFIGSGLSKRYLRSPDWKSLLKQIAKEAKCNYENIEKQCNGEYEKVAQELEYYCFRDASSEDLENSNRRTILRNLIAKIFMKCLEEFNETEILKNNKSYNKDISKHLEIIDGIDELDSSDNVQKYEYEYTQMKEKLITCAENIRSIIEIIELRKINPKAIITTNYDTLIEDIIFEGRCNVHIGQEGFSSILSETDKIDLYKIHGCVTKPDSIIITKEDYDNFFHKGKYLYSKIFTLFCEYPVIFIGYSVSDRNIKDILTVMTEIMTEQQKEELLKHIWVVEFVNHEEDEQVNEKEIELLSGKKIKVTCFNLKFYDKLYKAINKIVLNQKFEDLKFTISDQVIELLIEPLYEQQEKLKVVTRELLQNALDACKKKDVNTDIKIRILNDGGENYLEIEDNGIGMDLTELRQNFLTVGRTNKKNNSMGMVGEYGIGILSIFLIGNEAEVYTKKKGGTPLCLRLYINGERKQVEWLNSGTEYVNKIDKESFTVIKICLNNEIVNRKIKDIIKMLGLEMYVSKPENSIMVEYINDKEEIPKVEKAEWFLELSKGIKMYKGAWLNEEESELSESEKKLKERLDTKGFMFYNDMVSAVNFDLSPYTQLKNMNVPFIMVDIKDVNSIKKDIKTDLSRSGLQVTGETMHSIARGIYQLEIKKIVGIINSHKEKLDSKEISNYELLDLISKESKMVNNNIDILVYKDKLFFSKMQSWYYVNVKGSWKMAETFSQHLSEPILYEDVVLNRSSISNILESDDKVCISEKYLNDYIYRASSANNGLRKKAMVEVLHFLGYKDVDMDQMSSIIWQYVKVHRDEIRAAYHKQSINGILWFKNKGVGDEMSLGDDYLVVYESGIVKNSLDKNFFEVLQENINSVSVNNIIDVYTGSES